MDRKEAVRRIKEHMIVHKLKEERAIFIIAALNEAIKSLEAWDQVIKELQQYYDDAAAANEIISGTQQFTIENCIEIVKRNLGGLKNEDQEKESFYF